MFYVPCLQLDLLPVFAALKQELLRKHKDALQTCKSHNLALLKSNQQGELEVKKKKKKSKTTYYSEHHGTAVIAFDLLTAVRLSGFGSSSARGAEDDG